MPIEWAGLSPELILPLDRGRPEPLRSQLEGGLREAIRSGRLQVEERLPSSRELARQPGPVAGRFPLRRARPGELPASRLAVGAARDLPQRADLGAGLRRSPRQP